MRYLSVTIDPERDTPEHLKQYLSISTSAQIPIAEVAIQVSTCSSGTPTIPKERMRIVYAHENPRADGKGIWVDHFPKIISGRAWNSSSGHMPVRHRR